MQPIKKIMGVLGVSKENQDNEYDSIMDSVQNLLVNNQNLESCLEDALPLAREEFWKKLLYGRIFQEESIENGRRQLGLTELGREYLIEVIYLNLEGAYTTQYLQECAVYRLMIHNFYKDMGAVFCIDHAGDLRGGSGCLYGSGALEEYHGGQKQGAGGGLWKAVSQGAEAVWHGKLPWRAGYL